MKLNLFAVACASVLAFANGTALADEPSYDELSQTNADSHLHTHSHSHSESELESQIAN